MNEFDTIIIGSGAGGLTAALCLARAGQKVAVLEQHSVPGGWCHSFYIDGHRFSPGVHYIGLMDKGSSTSKLYEGLGIANDLVFFRMNPKAYEHCWIGDNHIDLPANSDKLFETLAKKFPKEKKGLRKYLDLIENVSEQLYLIPKMNGFWDNITIPYRTRHLGKYALFSLKKVIGWHIKDPLLQKVLNIQCGDHGLPPSKASFPLHCALMAHYFQGGFYPMGGGAAIVKAMTKTIKKNGGLIRTGASVKRILIEKQEKNQKSSAVGVELENGDILRAKRIISNTDPTTTFKMVGTENISKKLQEKLHNTRYSVTSLMFFITVDMDVRQAGLDSGNIWIMPDCEMNDLHEDLTECDSSNNEGFGSLFISCSTLKDPSSYNGRHHTLEIVTFIDYDTFISKIKNGDQNSEEYLKFKGRLCDKIVVNLENIIPGLKNHIVQIQLGTPLTNEHYIKSTKGNVYGTEKGFYQTGPFSFNAKTEIENLYMCGASIMAHGIAGASYSGLKTAALILNCKEEDLIKTDDTQNVRIYEAEDNTNWPTWLIQKMDTKKSFFKVKINSSLKPA
ncbi:MAG: NAD(P)/FAD-dependent oxidoreductase [Bacteroidetes bacterium]|nr:NAD(P)/FAD-dependent oxidoreductase [Bacteroidota bacterium]